MGNSLISVVVPVYNAERFLRKTIDSVIAQTYQNWELLLIDDCSTDASLKIAREYARSDARIRVLTNKRNQGVARIRNLGIQEAKGEYIALLDSDDAWTADKLERQVRLVKEYGAAIVYCSYDFMDEKDAPIMKSFVVPRSTNFKSMLVSSVISCSTALIDAKLLKAHPFDPTYYHEDYVLWMELLQIPVKAVGDPKVLAHYRIVKGSRSNNKRNAAIERWKIYRKRLHMGVVPSAVAFVRYMIYGVIKYYL